MSGNSKGGGAQAAEPEEEGTWGSHSRVVARLWPAWRVWPDEHHSGELYNSLDQRSDFPGLRYEEPSVADSPRDEWSPQGTCWSPRLPSSGLAGEMVGWACWP